VYCPIGTAKKAKRPSGPAVTWRFDPWVLLDAVIWAPGTAAPLESTTVPLIVPVVIP
jgi:hypothetical protein